MKVSATTITISLLLLIAIGLGVYYYSRKEASIAQAWVESSWAYRKSIYVENKESTLLNKDILLEIDTKVLIESGKLQDDCDDLRFQEGDNQLSLDYWIENGCNTSKTRIWVRIPSLRNPGEEIYMFYGNPTALRVQGTLTINN